MKLWNYETMKENICIDIQKLDVLDKETHFQVETFCSSSEPQRVSGKDCFVMQPAMDTLDGKVVYTFDKSMIFDMVMASTNVPKKSTSSSTSRNCFLCLKNVNLQDMKIHVGVHILDETDEGAQPCGYFVEEAVAKIH